MKRKIITGVVAAALIIGILSVVFSSSLPSSPKTGSNSTGIAPPAPAPKTGSNSTGIAPPALGNHYGVVLNETTVVTAHP